MCKKMAISSGDGIVKLSNDRQQLRRVVRVAMLPSHTIEGKSFFHGRSVPLHSRVAVSLRKRHVACQSGHVVPLYRRQLADSQTPRLEVCLRATLKEVLRSSRKGWSL